MTGIFYTATTTNGPNTSARQGQDASTRYSYVDTAQLSNVTDSNPWLVAETDNWTAAVAGYGFTDNPAGTGNAFAGPVYACPRVATPSDPDAPGPGARAFFYNDGYVPNPTASYPHGAAVPGARIVTPQAWITLAEDRLAMATGGLILLGQPGLPTSASTFATPVDYLPRYARAWALLTDGTLVVASQAVRDSDSQPVILLTDPFASDLAHGSTVQRAAEVYTYDGVNPWKAALAALCVRHQGQLLKAVGTRFVAALGRWSTFLAAAPSASTATLYSLPEAMWSTDPGAAIDVDIYQSVLNYALVGDALTYNSVIGGKVFDGDQAVQQVSLMVGTAQTAWVDSDQYVPPPRPLFWTGLTRAVEIA